VNIHEQHAGNTTLPYYEAFSIISSCTITKQPTPAISKGGTYNSNNAPFSVQVSNKPTLRFRYIIASVHIVVRQNGVILGGASSVVDPYTGTASLGNFKLVSSGNLASITYDVVANGVVCARASTPLFAQASSVFLGNSIKIATLPSDIYLYPEHSNLLSTTTVVRSVYVGVQSESILFVVNDNFNAILVGVIVKIQV
jgi:hypothetical protein